jgi:hypothetical protein
VSLNQNQAIINQVTAYTKQVLAITKQVDGLHESGLYCPRVSFTRQQVAFELHQKSEGYLQKNDSLHEMSVSPLRPK